MTKISTYVIDDKVTALDKWIGSDANMQNKTKNFTPKKLAAYFNENQVINIGTPLQYKYYTLDPLEARPNGTLTFETEIGPTVNFSSVTSFILSKYTTKQNIISEFLNFLDGSKILLFKSSDINSFGFYRISDIAIYDEDPNFFVVTVEYETGNGFMQEDEDYMISLVSLAGDFIPTKTSELINDGDDGVNPFISELDIDRTEWDEAYEGKINSAEVTGDTTKTLTLTKQDGSTIEASWTDDNTDAVTSVFGRDGDVVAETGDYNTDQVTEGDNLYFTEGRSRSSVSLTTTGSNGEATYDSVTGVFNIPNYSEDLVDYVPYTGATKDVNLGIHQLKADSLAVSITSAEAVDIGGIVWNPIDGTFDMGLIGGVTLQAGQELHMYGKATEAISNGQAIMFAGVQGDHILVAKADAATINANPEYLIGIATQNFSNNQFGYVTVFGNVRGLNTTAYTLGSVLYYNSESSTDGLLTATEPTAPNAKIIVAAVVRVHVNQGILLVRPHVMPKLKDIQDVHAPSPSDKNGLFWNNTNSRYENNSIAGILGYTPANDSNVVKLTGVQTVDGIKTFSESTKFDYGVYLKQDGVTASFPGYTTIDGTTNGYVVTNGDGRTAFFNLANVTSLGYTYPSTSGTLALTSDLHNPVTIGTANGLSLSGQQLSLGLASSTLNGALSSTDWNVFNNKQAAGNYITSLTGEATASGPGAAAVTLNNASVTGKILSGVNITGGTILDTDSMLTAFGKLQNQINSLIGGSIYQGVWNANTNTPTLTSSVGTDGYYYIVNVAGSTNLNGITDWNVGDWAIFHGGTWQKVDNTDAVSSVNGFTGAVSLTTDNISEGITNQYFLNSRARAALSFAAGSGAYNSTTGVITIPTNNNQITNGSNFITLASLSGSAPIQYNNTTGAISITQAGASSNGFLSSTDWNTFNNKQNALTNPITGTGTTNYLPKFTGASALGNSQIFDNGTGVGIGTTSPLTALTVSGNLSLFTTNQIRLYNSAKNNWTQVDSPLLSGDTEVDFRVVTKTGTFYINASGNVGIGTTSPSFAFGSGLHVRSNSGWGEIKAEGIAGAGAAVTLYSNGTILGDISADVDKNLSFRSDNAERMRIYSNGNVFIGSSPSDAGFKLDVNGTGIFRNILRVDMSPPATSGGMLALRDTLANGSNTSFGGVFFNSSPGADFSIGKLSEAGNGFLQIRNGNNGSELLRINSTGAATFSSSVTATQGFLTATANTYAGGALRLTAHTGGRQIFLTSVGTNFALSNGGSADHLIIASTGAATFSSSVTASGFIANGNSAGGFEGLRIVNASTGAAQIALNNSAQSWLLNTRTDNHFSIFNATASTTPFFINTSGNVGIGTTSPAVKLQIAQTASGTTNNFTQLITSSDGGKGLYQGFDITNRRFYWRKNDSNDYSFSWQKGDGTNMMLITSGGNVGIGTTSPQEKFEVAGLNGNIRLYGRSGITNNSISSNLYYNGSSWVRDVSGGASSIVLHPTNGLIFNTTAATSGDVEERMRITSGGFIKASNTGSYYSTTATYHEFNNNALDVVLRATSSNASPYGISVYFTASDPNNTTNYIYNGYATSSGTNLYTIWSNGTTSGRSDARLKKNIVDSTPKLDKLLKLRVVNYEWKENIGGSKELGLIAQEVEEIFPNLIITSPIVKEKEVVLEDGSIEMKKYEDGDYKSLKNSVLPYITIKALQELAEQVKELKAEIEILKQNK